MRMRKKGRSAPSRVPAARSPGPRPQHKGPLLGSTHFRHVAAMGLCVLAFVASCCVYLEEPTRNAFRELSEDATDLATLHQRCMEDPQGNATVCAAVQATLLDIAEKAEIQANIGQKETAQ